MNQRDIKRVLVFQHLTERSTSRLLANFLYLLPFSKNKETVILYRVEFYEGI